MKAVAITKFGKPEVAFTIVEYPAPVIGEEEILVKVKATSVNPIDTKIRAGLLPGLVLSFPAILHGDVAGEVTEIGSKVAGFQLGDKVYGCIGAVNGIQGALAEYTKGDYRLFSKIPENLEFTAAAAIPLAGITAYQAIFQHSNIKAGQKILIYGGVGGVGSLAIQFAKVLGAVVYATISNEQQAAIAKELGADYTINYKEVTVEDYVKRYTDGKGFDIVFDTVGNQNLTNSFQAAKVKGTVVTTLSLVSLDLSPIHQKALTFHTVYMILPILSNDVLGKAKYGEILRHIAALVDEGKVKPLIDQHIFPFTEAKSAHEYAESGSSSGKIILSTAD